MKLSIITINYNNRDGLRKTIESVVAQTTRDFEYIIIDGGSTDGSVDVIKEYADRIDYWVSEPDKGIYNAMNKGVAAAHGDFCQFLNSGDWLYSNIVIEAVLPYLIQDYDILSGEQVLHLSDGQFKGQYIPTPERLSSLYFIQATLPHPASFIKSELLRKRPYNESYKIIADWIFFFESFLYGNIRFQKLLCKIACFDAGGISGSQIELREEERKRFTDSISLTSIESELSCISHNVGGQYAYLRNSYKLKHFLDWMITTISSTYLWVRPRIPKRYESAFYPPSTNNSKPQEPEKITKKKRLSIITINYNNRDGLRKTIESVVTQTTHDFEYIIIDGGSTDGSVDVIKEYADRIDYWVSEPDKGIYNAMNKGVAVAHGEYCQFLNSGDALHNEMVVERFINNNDNQDVIVGRTLHLYPDKKILGPKIDPVFTFMNVFRGIIIHQAAFVKTLLCIEHPYDEKYRFAADYKFFIEILINNNCSFSTSDDVIVDYDQNGVSSVHLGETWKERADILSSMHFPPRILADYELWDKESYVIAKLLHPYDGFRKFICRQIERLVYLYTKISRYKHQ